MAERAGVAAADLTLLFAPTASLAGSVQVAARVVETALHKLHELEFDVGRVVSGFGSCPLPPVARKDPEAIGRTNDAVLYGGQVELTVDAPDEELEAVVPRLPSSASDDYGEPFGHVLEAADWDFYKIDPLLFSPAEVRLVSVASGRSFHAGAWTSASSSIPSGMSDRLSGAAIIETVTTTINPDGTVNCAAMGVEWGDDVIVIKPFPHAHAAQPGGHGRGRDQRHRRHPAVHAGRPRRPAPAYAADDDDRRRRAGGCMLLA